MVALAKQPLFSFMKVDYIVFFVLALIWNEWILTLLTYDYYHPCQDFNLLLGQYTLLVLNKFSSNSLYRQPWTGFSLKFYLVRSKISDEYGEADGLGRDIAFYSNKIGQKFTKNQRVKHANFSCFEKTISRQNWLLNTNRKSAVGCAFRKLNYARWCTDENMER